MNEQNGSDGFSFDEDEFRADLARRLGLENPAFRLGEGEFYDPATEMPTWRGRIEFVQAAARVAPSLLETLATDVFPIVKAEGEVGLYRVLDAWQARWSLPDDWVQEFVRIALEPCRAENENTMLSRLQENWGTIWWSVEHSSAAGRKRGWVPSALFQFLYAPWSPEFEWRANYVAFVRDSFERALNQYLDDIEQRAEAAGLLRTPEKRARGGAADQHFEWLARFQVQGWSYGRIAKHYKVTEKTVKTAIPATAKLIGLTRRTLAEEKTGGTE